MTYEDAEKRANIKFVTEKLAPRFKSYVDADDIFQEIAVYAWGDGVTELERWHGNAEPHRIYLAMFGVGQQFAERAKAAALGYNFEDIAWYSPDSLKDIIPLALDRTFDGQKPIEYGQISGSSVASQGGTLLAMIMDVRRALAATHLGGVLRHQSEDSDEAVAARQAIANFLGGDYPSSPLRGKPRRQVLSNAAAVSLTAQEN